MEINIFWRFYTTLVSQFLAIIVLCNKNWLWNKFKRERVQRIRIVPFDTKWIKLSWRFSEIYSNITWKTNTSKLWPWNYVNDQQLQTVELRHPIAKAWIHAHALSMYFSWSGNMQKRNNVIQMYTNTKAGGGHSWNLTNYKIFFRLTLWK